MRIVALILVALFCACCGDSTSYIGNVDAEIISVNGHITDGKKIRDFLEEGKKVHLGLRMYICGETVLKEANIEHVQAVHYANFKTLPLTVKVIVGGWNQDFILYLGNDKLYGETMGSNNTEKLRRCLTIEGKGVLENKSKVAPNHTKTNPLWDPEKGGK